MTLSFPTIAPITTGSTFNVHEGIDDQLQKADLALSLEAIRLSNKTPTVILRIPLNLKEEVSKDSTLRHLVQIDDEVAKDALSTMILKQIEIFKTHLDRIASPARNFTYKLCVTKDASSAIPSNLKIDEDKIAGSFPISIAQLHGISLQNDLEDGRLASVGQGFNFIHSASTNPACSLISAKSRENATFVGIIQASYPRDTLEVLIEASF